MVDNTLGVGFIGVGGQGEEQVRAFAALPGIRIETVCDMDADRASAIAARYGAALDHEYGRSLGLQRCADGVYRHAGGLSPGADPRVCLAAGKHVLLEKPISTRLDEAQLLFEQAERYGRVLAPAHLLRFHPAYAALKERIASGRLGRVVQLAEETSRRPNRHLSSSRPFLPGSADP